MALFRDMDPATVSSVQQLLGVPVTGVWDDASQKAVNDFYLSKNAPGRDGTDNAAEWEWLIAALKERRQEIDSNPALQDAAYQAYLRQAGYQESSIRNEMQARIESTQRAINRAAAGFEQQKSDSNKNIQLGFEDRGLSQSGVRQNAQAEAGAKIDYQRQMDEAQQNDALTEANRRSQASLADIAQRRAEEELAARQRVTEKRGQAIYNPTGV